MKPAVILKRRAPGLRADTLRHFVLRACRAARLRGTVTVMVTSDREMRTLNSRFRGKKSDTDVLSFPASATADGMAGDIAISLPLAALNARRLGHSVADEVRVLVLHGVLHLAGYDHETDDGEMAARELQLRRRLSLPEALTERVTTGSNNNPHSSDAKSGTTGGGTRAKLSRRTRARS